MVRSVPRPNNYTLGAVIIVLMLLIQGYVVDPFYLCQWYVVYHWQRQKGYTTYPCIKNINTNITVSSVQLLGLGTLRTMAFTT